MGGRGGEREKEGGGKGRKEAISVMTALYPGSRSWLNG